METKNEMNDKIYQLAKDVLTETRHGPVPNATTNALAFEVTRLHRLLTFIKSCVDVEFRGPSSVEGTDDLWVFSHTVGRLPNGEPVRDFHFATDAASAIEIAMERKNRGGL